MVMVMEKILMITDTMNERMLKRGDDPLGGSKYISQSRHMHSQEQLLMMMLTAMVMVVMVMVVTMVWSQKHKLLYCSRCVDDWGGEILYNDDEIGMMSGHWSVISDDFCHFCFLRRDFYIEQNESVPLLQPWSNFLQPVWFVLSIAANNTFKGFIDKICLFW